MDESDAPAGCGLTVVQRAIVERLLLGFDFELVLWLMGHLGWRWRGRPVTREILEHAARELASHVVSNPSLVGARTGGLEVEINRAEGSLRLAWVGARSEVFYE